MPAFTLRVPVALFSLSLLAFVPVTGFAQEIDAEPAIELTQPTGPRAVLGGVASASTRDGAVLISSRATDQEAEFHWARVATPGRSYATVYLTYVSPDGPALPTLMQEMITEPTSVVQSEFRGQSVWIIDGTSENLPDWSEPSEGAVAPVRMIITRNCVPDQGTLLIAAMVDAAQAENDGFEDALGPITLMMPENAEPCSAELDELLGRIAERLAAEQTAAAALPSAEDAADGAPTTDTMAPADDAAGAEASAETADQAPATEAPVADTTAVESERSVADMAADEPAAADDDAAADAAETSVAEAPLVEAPVVDASADDAPTDDAPEAGVTITADDAPALAPMNDPTAPADFAPVPEDTPAAAAPLVPMFAHLVGVTLPPETQVAETTLGTPFNRIALAHPEAMDTPHTLLLIGDTAPDGAAVSQGVADQFSSIDQVTDGTFQGAAVWIIDGESRVGPDGLRAAPGSAPRARIMVTQACPPADGPVMLGAVTTSTRGVPAIMDVILGGMTLSMPSDARPCPANIGEALMALPLGPVAVSDGQSGPEAAADLPAQPAAAFGLAYQVPEGMTIRRQRDDDSRRELTLTNVDEETDTGTEITLRVLTPAQRRRMVEAPVDSPEFIAFLARVSQMDVQRTETVTQVGSLRYRHFVGSGSLDINGQMQSGRFLYLVTETPSATGLSPWIGVGSVGVPDDQAAAIEAMVLSSLTLDDPVVYDGTQQISFLDGAIRVAVLPGDTVQDSEAVAGFGRMMLSNSATPDTAHTLYVLEQRDADSMDLIADMQRRFEVISAVTAGQIDETPVWMIEGRVDRAPNGRRSQDGSTSPGLMAVTRHCAPGGGPLIIGLLTADDRLSGSAPFASMLAPVRLTMPDGSAPCSAQVDAALADLVIRSAAPMDDADSPPPAVSLPEVTMPPATSPVVPEDGKPGTEVVPDEPAQTPTQPEVAQTVTPQPATPEVSDPPTNGADGKPGTEVIPEPEPQTPSADPSVQPQAPAPVDPLPPVADDTGKPATEAAPVQPPQQPAQQPPAQDPVQPQTQAAPEQPDAGAGAGAESGKPSAEAALPTAPMAPNPADDLAWGRALASGDATNIRAYLQDFPQGAHLREAQEWLRMNAPTQNPALAPAPAQGALPQQPAQPRSAVPDPQETAWQNALVDGTANAFLVYLQNHPRGPHADEARAILEGRARPPAPQVPAPQVPAPQTTVPAPTPLPSKRG